MLRKNRRPTSIRGFTKSYEREVVAAGRTFTKGVDNRRLGERQQGVGKSTKKTEGKKE